MYFCTNTWFEGRHSEEGTAATPAGAGAGAGAGVGVGAGAGE